ncbi:MAG: metal-dependent hydrolase [Flavobacteriales bacterium]|nr:metal-dependent hydrolase [Flavobacteriales bacterium]
MLNVTYYGHSCFLVETGGSKILFDPFISPNELAKEINLDGISCDYIFVSHGHPDHIADLEYLGKKLDCTIVSSFEICNWISDKGIKKVHSMNLGGEWDFNFGRVKMVYAAHSNSLPDGTYGGTASGFVFKNTETCFYYAGDTALTNDMNLIPLKFNLDLAFLPIGNNYTMSAEDAALATDFIKCKKIIGMHYDTFGFIKIDHQKALESFKAKGANLTLMGIGETANF